MFEPVIRNFKGHVELRNKGTLPRGVGYYNYSTSLKPNRDLTIPSVGLFSGTEYQIWDITKHCEVCRLVLEAGLIYFEKRFILCGDWMLITFTTDDGATLSRVDAYDVSCNSTLPGTRLASHTVAGFSYAFDAFETYLYGLKLGTIYYILGIL